MRLLAVLLVALSGCGLQPLKTGKVDPGVSQLQVKAQSVINEGYRLLAASDKEIGQSAADGIFTPDDAQVYLNRAIASRKKLDGYQKLLNSGDINAVLSGANVEQLVADALLKEVLARAIAAKKKPTTQFEEFSPFLATA